MQPLAAVQTSSPEPRSAKITFKKVYQILLRVNGIFFFFFFFARPDFRGYVSGFSQFSLSCGVNRAERGVTAFSWPKWNESLPNIIAKHLGSSTMKE